MKMSLIYICLILASSLQAQDQKNINQMDNVLDRLERKLMEQEAASLNITAPLAHTKPKSSSQKIELPASILAAPLPEEKAFMAMNNDIRQLEQDTDELSGQIEKLKSEFLASSGKDNYIEISAKIEDPDSSVLRTMSLSIDQHSVFETTDREGQWIPGPEILLYSGPLEAGEHKLQIKARVVGRVSGNLPLDQNLYHLYDQTFTVGIPNGNYRNGYRIKIAKPEKQNIHAQAGLENYKIP